MRTAAARVTAASRRLCGVVLARVMGANAPWLAASLRARGSRVAAARIEESYQSYLTLSYTPEECVATRPTASRIADEFGLTAMLTRAGARSPRAAGNICRQADVGKPPGRLLQARLSDKLEQKLPPFAATSGSRRRARRRRWRGPSEAERTRRPRRGRRSPCGPRCRALQARPPRSKATSSPATCTSGPASHRSWSSAMSGTRSLAEPSPAVIC